jgi:hypothetical protein
MPPTFVARSASDAKARTGIVVALLRQQMLATSECACSISGSAGLTDSN